MHAPLPFADDAPASPENDARARTHTMGKRCVFATIATIVAVAIALGVGLGLGLKSDDAAAGVFVFGETELTGFSSSEFNGNPNNALNFRRGVASLSNTVEYNDVTITSVTDVARRRAALRKILAVSSRVKIAFNVAVSDATEQTNVKTTYQAVTPTQLKTALTGQGLSVTAATAPTVTVTAPAPSRRPPHRGGFVTLGRRKIERDRSCAQSDANLCDSSRRYHHRGEWRFSCRRALARGRDSRHRRRFLLC